MRKHQLLSRGYENGILIHDRILDPQDYPEKLGTVLLGQQVILREVVQRLRNSALRIVVL